MSVRGKILHIHTHDHTGNISSGLSMSFGKTENETSARQIFIGSFPTLSFILVLILSSVHLKNIKCWFMEMSGWDPVLGNTTTADWTTTLLMCFITITICYTHNNNHFACTNCTVATKVKHRAQIGCLQQHPERFYGPQAMLIKNPQIKQKVIHLSSNVDWLSTQTPKMSSPPLKSVSTFSIHKQGKS